MEGLGDQPPLFSWACGLALGVTGQTAAAQHCSGTPCSGLGLSLLELGWVGPASPISCPQDQRERALCRGVGGWGGPGGPGSQVFGEGTPWVSGELEARGSLTVSLLVLLSLSLSTLWERAPSVSVPTPSQALGRVWWPSLPLPQAHPHLRE